MLQCVAVCCSVLQCVAVCEFEMLEVRSFDIESKRVGGMGGMRGK